MERQLERAAEGVRHLEGGDDGPVSAAAHLGFGRPDGRAAARRRGEEEERARPELQGQDPAAAPRERAGVIPSPAA
jgi:hypothetical protein